MCKCGWHRSRIVRRWGRGRRRARGYRTGAGCTGGVGRTFTPLFNSLILYGGRRWTAVAVYDCIVIIIGQDVEGVVSPGDALMNSGESSNFHGRCYGVGRCGHPWRCGVGHPQRCSNRHPRRCDILPPWRSSGVYSRNRSSGGFSIRLARHDIGESSDHCDVLYFVLRRCLDGADELREESICSEQCFIVLRDDQYLAVAQIETPSVSKPKPPCSWDIETETTV